MEGIGPTAPYPTTNSLENNHILHVTASDDQGQSATTSFDLDSVIGNVNGALSWGATGFSSQARNVTLADNGQTLDAELPDANGEYAPSSIAIIHDIGMVNGSYALRMVLGIPHSTVHAETGSTEEADQKILEQISMVGDHSAPVTQVKTLQQSDLYALANVTAGMVRENGPAYGQVLSVISAVKTAATVAVGLTAAKEHNMCCVM